jgi:hypothetical protein
VSGDILAGQIVTVIYDGTQFIMTSPSANTISSQNLLQADSVQKQTYTYWHNLSNTDSYIINPTPAVSSYTDGQYWCIYTSVGNTGSCSLSVNGLASIPIKKMNPSGNLIDLDTGDICANEIFIVIYNSAANCFVLVAPTRLCIPINGYCISQTDPQTLLNYGTWSYGEPIDLGLFHFNDSFSSQTYDGYYNYLLIQGGSLSSTYKFGAKSLSIPDTSSGIYTNIYFPPRAKLQRGLQIDMWIKYSNSLVTAYLWGDSNGINFKLSSGNLILNDKTTQLLSSSGPTANTWYHIAMAYWWDSNGRYVSMWFNGSRVGTVQTLTSTSAAFGSNNQILTRTDNSSPNTYNLYVDELHIIDSTPTYGDTYTVPTAPYTPSGPLPNLWIRTA